MSRNSGRGMGMVLFVVAVAALVLAAAPRAATPAVDAAFARFWHASDVGEAVKAADAVVGAGATFDEALAQLKKGRVYAATVPRGVVHLTRHGSLNDFPYMLDVPQDYDPARQYQVRIQLHGGVGRPDPAPRGEGIGALGGAEQIYILPTAWSAAEWWTDQQLENLRAILDSVKRTYNVDENRVVLSGVSDGGTGTYYLSMRDTTPFAAFLPLNGALAVLQGASAEIDGEMFPNNLLNKPFFIVNGGRDPLYPTSLVEPYIRQMVRGGVDVKYLPQPEAVHNTAWWPDVKNTFEAFVHEHPRHPLPETLTWETDLTGETNRAHWLVIDALARPQADRAPLDDVNDVRMSPEPSFGIRAAGTMVTGVAAGSNAETFKLLPGDVILQLDDRTIPAAVDVLDLLSLHEPKTKLILTVRRNGETLVLAGMFEPTPLPRILPMFVHRRPSGRVDLVRTGNTVTATTRRVAEFTLLLSPDAFDFSKPVTVVADGRVVFDSRVTPSVATLLKWAARDNDRTMLFGAEVKVKLQ